MEAEGLQAERENDLSVHIDVDAELGNDVNEA